MYQVIWLTRALKSLKRIDQRYQERILVAVRREMSAFPCSRNIKKLNNSEMWRMRVCDYRVLFSIDAGKVKIITIEDVLKRTSTTYKER